MESLNNQPREEQLVFIGPEFLEYAPPSLAELVEEAKSVIKGLFLKGHALLVPVSGGKDSGAVASLVLTSARELVEMRADINPLVIVTTSNTLIENPEVEALYTSEHIKMDRYAAKHGFRLVTRVAQPTLAASFQMKILSGRGIPSFAGTSSDCSQDLKIQPQKTLRNSIFKALRAEGINVEPVTCLGTRYSESERRSANMTLRGESSTTPVPNKDGELILSPIAHWSVEDVWEYIASVSSSGESYSDFQEMMRVYANSEGQGCAIVADTIRESMSTRKKGGCGARHGCFLCQQVGEDRSLVNMVEHDARYGYAKGLVKLNRFIRNTRYDWSRRHWLGRTIRQGWIAVQPDTYHPRMVRELFRYMVQLDYDESVRAQRCGESPRFSILPPEMIVAVDAYWSLGGLANPFAAISDYVDITAERVRYEIPEIDPVPETPQPDARFLYVGNEWDDSHRGSYMTGLRDTYFEALTEDAPCQPGLRELKDGRVVWDADTALSFSVNPESIAMIWDFELEGLARMHKQGYGAIPGGITSGYKWYLMYGAITLSYGQVMEHDETLRRTAFKHRLGFSLDYEIPDLLAKSVSYAELPPEARLIWKHKATTSSAQPDLPMAAATAA